MKPRYSGDKSEKFWRKIANIQDPKIHDLLYSAGCALQDHELRVLDMLAAALSRHGSEVPRE